MCIEAIVESQDQALDEEMAYSHTDVTDSEGIVILTNARHCWTRNACFSDVLCLGDKTHKVLKVETISHDDDICSQCHEALGVRRIFQYLDTKCCTVARHVH